MPSLLGLRTGGTCTSLMREVDMADSCEQNREGQIDTVDATPTTIVTYGCESMVAIKLNVKVIAISPDNNNAKCWDQTMLVKRLDGSVTITANLADIISPAEDAGAASWAIQAVGSGTDVLIQVVGQASTRVNWFCALHGMCVMED